MKADLQVRPFLSAHFVCLGVFYAALCGEDEYVTKCHENRHCSYFHLPNDIVKGFRDFFRFSDLYAPQKRRK